MIQNSSVATVINLFDLVLTLGGVWSNDTHKRLRVLHMRTRLFLAACGEIVVYPVWYHVCVCNSLSLHLVNTNTMTTHTMYTYIRIRDFVGAHIVRMCEINIKIL